MNVAHFGVLLPEDEHYMDTSLLMPRLGIFSTLNRNQYGEVARDNIAPHHSFGLDAARPDNLKYIEPGKIMYAAGNALMILEVSTMRRRLIFGLDGGGIGCFGVHPSRTFVAVGEKGMEPNIYIYEYPSFRIAKVKLVKLYEGNC